MAKIADVRLVGSNSSIGVFCDGLICADIKYMIHMTSVDNETKKALISYKENAFGFDGLTADYKKAFEIFGEEVVYDKATLEDILMYYTRG